jgi:hypothetical protein
VRVTIAAMAESESDGTPKQDTDQYHTGRESWFVEGSERPAEPEPTGPQRTIHEPARETPVHEETDVLVVGGGPAGCAASAPRSRSSSATTTSAASPPAASSSGSTG